jgi:anti-sigma-K factor RskA
MNADEEERLDLAAAEYALGTMRGARADDFERRMRADPSLAQRVRLWESRLAPAPDAASPGPAPVALWAGIERRLGSGPAARTGAIAFWRRVAAACATVAVVGVASLAYVGANPPRPQCYAVLADGEARPVAVVFDRRDMRELVVLPVGAQLAGGAGTARLWIVAGGRAVAVGDVGADGETRLPLDKPLSTALMAPGARFVVARSVDAVAAGAPGATIADGIIALLGPASPARRT